MSGVMKPLETLFGVVINRVSSSRALMFPSLDATYARAYSRRPASTMSARTCSSMRVLISWHGAHAEGCALRGPLVERRLQPPRSRPAPEAVAAAVGAEIVRYVAGSQSQRV